MRSALCWCAIVVASCSVLPVAPDTPLQTYVLNLSPAQERPGVASCAPRSATLLINLPRAQAGFNTPRMAYLHHPHELRYYANNQWADTPARLLAPLLVQAIEHTACWQTVVQMPTAVQGDYRLETDIVHWQQEFFSQPSRVRLTLREQLVNHREQEVIATRRFEVIEPAPSEDAPGGVLAANRAVDRLLHQVADWLREQLHAHPHAHP